MNSKSTRIFEGDHVLRNKIHKESVGSELRYEFKNQTTHFQLNPNTVTMVAAKPNYITPDQMQGNPQETMSDIKKHQKEDADLFRTPYTDDPVEEAFSNEKLVKTLKSKTLKPKQKYQTPLTSNQEIGWYSNQLYIKKQSFDHKIKMCDTTKFADNYSNMMKINPFKIRNR